MIKVGAAQYFKERYDIKCPACGHLMQCAPSIFHKMGQFDLGSGNCIKCNQMFRIKLKPETNSMATSILKE